MMTRLSILFVLALAGLSCAKKEVPAAPEPTVQRAVPVLVQSLRESRFDLSIELSGSTEAWREANLAAEVAATVSSFPTRLGEELLEGQKILTLDSRLYRALLDQAEAGFLAAEAASEKASLELRRATKLRQKKHISDAEFEAVELAQKQAESARIAASAARDLAGLQLEDCEIRAPFRGRLALAAVEEGEQVAPGMPVAALVDLSRIRVRGALSESEVVKVSPGMPVNVQVPALGEHRFEGRVETVGVRSDPLTRSFPIEILVDNPDGKILSGMAVRNSIVVEQRPSAIVIPADAVVEQFGQPVAYVVLEGTARRTPLVLGARNGSQVEVLEGLSAGDRLIVSGQWSVRDGMAVEIQE